MQRASGSHAAFGIGCAKALQLGYATRLAGKVTRHEAGRWLRDDATRGVSLRWEVARGRLSGRCAKQTPPLVVCEGCNPRVSIAVDLCYCLAMPLAHRPLTVLLRCALIIQAIALLWLMGERANTLLRARTPPIIQRSVQTPDVIQSQASEEQSPQDLVTFEHKATVVVRLVSVVMIFGLGIATWVDLFALRARGPRLLLLILGLFLVMVLVEHFGQPVAARPPSVPSSPHDFELNAVYALASIAVIALTWIGHRCRLFGMAHPLEKS